MVLINGTKGIGTGFSTDIMCYNPEQIIYYLEGLLNKVDESEQKSRLIQPFYKGFKGKIIPCNSMNNKYLIKGCYEVLSKNH